MPKTLAELSASIGNKVLMKTNCEFVSSKRNYEKRTISIASKVLGQNTQEEDLEKQGCESIKELGNRVPHK